MALDIRLFPDNGFRSSSVTYLLWGDLTAVGSLALTAALVSGAPAVAVPMKLSGVVGTREWIIGRVAPTAAVEGVDLFTFYWSI